MNTNTVWYCSIRMLSLAYYYCMHALICLLYVRTLSCNVADLYFISLVCTYRIISLSKKNMPNICHIQLDATRLNVSAKLSVQSSSVWLTRSWCTAVTMARNWWLCASSSMPLRSSICLLARYPFICKFSNVWCVHKLCNPWCKRNNFRDDFLEV